MITISKDELKSLDELNKGNYGTCFMYEGVILKAYADTLPYHYNKREIKRNIKRSIGVKVDDVSFPIDTAKVNGFDFSYIMPCIKGYSLDEFFYKIINTDFDMSFDSFIHLYNDAIKKAYDIAASGIEINDLHRNNCKFKDDFTIGVFDVDFYEKKLLFNSLIEKKITYHNMLEVNEVFFDILKYIYNKKRIFSCTKEDIYELRKLYEIINNFPRNKKGYIDDVLIEINEELKKETVKDLIIR